MRAALVFLALVAATGFGARLHTAPQQQWRTERRTAGDTTIVRIVVAPPNAGLRRLTTVLSIGRDDGPNEYIFGAISEVRRAPDGSILVFDQQVPLLRKYDSTGRFIRNVGRKGEGPGEYTRVNGVAVSARGNVLVWDAPTRRIHVFSAAGEPSQSLTVPRPTSSIGLITSGGVVIDTAGYIYVQRVESNVPSGTEGTPAGPTIVTHTLFKFAADGRVVDTLELPKYGVTPPVVERRGARAGRGSGIVRALLPFTSSGSWALSPHGHFVASHGDRYAVDLLLPGRRVTRIERDIAAVPITPAERADAIAILETQVRRADPAYRFSGSTIPTTRPPVNGILVDDDARIWVSVAMPGERIPDPAPVPPGPPPPPAAPGVRRSNARGGGGARGSLSPDWQETYSAHFRAPIAYDVFATDGRFLGRVPMPNGVMPDVMKGDYIWAVTRDSLDVQRVVKFRIEPPLGRE